MPSRNYTKAAYRRARLRVQPNVGKAELHRSTNEIIDGALRKHGGQLKPLESPFTGGAVCRISHVRALHYQGRAHRVRVDGFQCVDTGQAFTTSEQDARTLRRLRKAARASN